MQSYYGPMNGHNNYVTRDFYLSACLLASGLEIQDITDQAGILFFSFNSDIAAAEEIVKQHWNGQLILPTKALTEAIYQLKNRMRQVGRA